MRISFKVAIALSTMLAMGASEVFATSIDYIGRVKLADQGETEIIRVSNCNGPQDKIRQINLRVSHDPARIDKLVVWYKDGQRDVLTVNKYIPLGGNAWFDLEGKAKCVRAMKIQGEAVGPAIGRKTFIDIYALMKF